jgi:integrase
MKRRGRGEGSIFQRQDGLWAGIITVGYDANGKRRRQALYGTTKGEVLEKLAHTRHAVLTGTLGEPGRLAVRDYLTRWLEDAARPKIRPGTHASYEELIRCHILPRLGGIALTKLNPAHVQHLLGEMEQGGASPRRRQMVYRVLSQALKRAVLLGLVPRNVCQAVTCPRPPKKTAESLTPEQAYKLLQSARGDRLEALYMLAATTGLRQGELFGLQPECIDLKNGRLFIKQQLCELDGRLWLAPPKTAKGSREIRLPEIALTALREHRQRQLANGHWRSDGYVFTDTLGGPLRKSNFLRHEWHPLLERAGIFKVGPAIDHKTGQPIIDSKTNQPKMRKVFLPFHSTRHTAATLLLMQGVHPRVVQELLGHASIAVTMDTYSHVLPSMGAEAASRMDALFSKPATVAKL